MKRVGNAFKGVLGGFIFLIIGIVLLWWNEGNNVKNIKSTAEMEKVYVDVTSDKVDAANEGKLIATNGKLLNEQELQDDVFSVTIKTPIMKRIVEVYQWEEDSSTDEDGDTTYSYSKKWSSSIIDSGNFHDKSHENPKVKPYEDKVYTSSDVKVGAFTLSSNQVDTLSTKGTFTDYNAEKMQVLNLNIVGNYVTNSQDLNNPQIGDTRVSIVYNNSTDISVLAVQQGNTFVDFVSKSGRSVNRVMDGTHSGIEMINVIKDEDNLIKWILRAVGIIALALGFGTILKPISAVTSYIPLLGNVVGAAVGLVSFILGLALGIVIIAVAWIRFRPVLGIGLLVAALVLVVILVLRGKKSKPVEQ